MDVVENIITISSQPVHCLSKFNLKDVVYSINVVDLDFCSRSKYRLLAW